MTETYAIAGPPRGEPLPAGQVGARVRIPLTGTPSGRWSQVMTARLGTALMGHPAVGHLELSSLVQGADIVLEGVEAAEAQHLGAPLIQAIEAANSDRAGHAAPPPAPNMSQAEADDIADLITLDSRPRADPPSSGR